MPNRLIYTKRLGAAVAKNAKGSFETKLHIISSLTGKWAVVPAGSARAMRSFSTQKAAVHFAKKYALSKSVAEVVVHDEYGKTRNIITI